MSSAHGNDNGSSMRGSGLAGASSHQPNRGRNIECRYHAEKITTARAKSVGRFENTDHVSHGRTADAVRLSKKSVAPEDREGAAGVKDLNRRQRGYLCGYEDMLPTTGKKFNKCDLPPSADYIRENEAKELKPAGRNKHTKFDLPPSDELKSYNERKAGERTSKSTVAYHPGAKEASDETRRFNDNKRLHGPDRPTPSKGHVADSRKHASDNMRDVMTPPANCAMSDKFRKHSVVVEDLRSETSGIESRVEMPLSARGPRRTSSEASFASGVNREPPLSARSSRTYSVASVEGFRPNRVTSEASFASSGAKSDCSHSEAARKHHSNRRGSALPTCKEDEASDVSGMSRSHRSDTFSEVSSYAGNRAGGKTSARSSGASDVMSTISESTACSTNDKRPLSVCSSSGGSFSYGGFSMDKAKR